MQKIDKPLLNNALTATEWQLQKRLPSEELQALGILLNRMAKRYPNQDVKDSMEEFLNDLEQLALKYSLRRVEEAIAALRINPNQAFFPKPDEVAAEMRRQRLKRVPSDIYARG